MKEEHQVIGETAGKIYEILDKKGQVTLSHLQKELKGLNVQLMHQAIGWLAREEKVSLTKKGKSAVVELA